MRPDTRCAARRPAGGVVVHVPAGREALERAEADRDGVLAWALGQGYLTHADLRL